MKRLLMLHLLLASVSCSITPNRTEPTRAPAGQFFPVSTSDDANWKLFDGPHLIPTGTKRAPAKVFLPVHFKSEAKWPLVILLHGFTGTALSQDFYFLLSARATSRGFIMLAPEGTGLPRGFKSPEGKDLSGKQFWNATDVCCDLAKSGVDDVSYLKDLIRKVKAQYPVDEKRIYLFGHSNGGFMANRLACEMGEELAGIASFAGGSFKDIAKCNRPVALPYLQIHAIDDPVIKYEDEPDYAGGKATVQQWLTRNGCTQASKPGFKKDFLVFQKGVDTFEESWSNCRSGKDVALWTIQSDPKQAKYAHTPMFQIGFTESVLDFLLNQKKD